MFLTTVLFNQFVASIGPALAKLRYLLCGGEQENLESFSTLMKHGGPENLIYCYGPTETTTFATTYNVTNITDQQDRLPIGRPISNTTVYVLDQHRQPVPLGCEGELYIGGAGVANGYLNRTTLTAGRFIPDPFSKQTDARMYRTGDLVRYLDDGNLVFVSRNDDQVKIRGFRIELGEIEAHLLEHPLVRETVVVALGTDSDKRLVAYVVSDAVNHLAQLMRDHLATALPEYMIPAAFVWLDSLPLTPNGKIDKRALPEPEVDYEEPRSEIETALAAIWADLLKIERVSRHDNFFMFGGHSLLAMRLLNRISTLGVNLQLSKIFESPILSELANTLASQFEQRNQSFDHITPISRNNPLPLSFAQQRLWFLAQIEGVSDAYNIPMAIRLQGTLDRDAWQSALNTIFVRHESLRSTFVNIEGQPQVRLLPLEHGAPMFIHDLRGEFDIEAQLHELKNLEASASFDLEKGPLIRSRLIQVADDEHVILLTQHHIASDGWSMGLFTCELSELYTAYCPGQSNPLPPLKIQYPDYAAWQKNWLSGGRLQEQSDFWRATLADAPVSITLPTDHPRPPQRSFVGAHVPICVDTHTTLALKQLGQQNGTTLFMTIMAAWSAVLSRLSGQDDVMIGTPSANRNHPDIEQLIGFFVNTLVMRIDLSGNPSISQLLERVRQCAIAAHAHQDLPFEQVVEIVQPPRRMDQSPLFQVMFAWQNNEEEKLHLLGVTLKPVEINYDIVKFDLDLSLCEANGEIVGSLSYSTALFDRSTIERHVGYLQAMLQAMVDDRTQLISEVDILSSSERELLLHTWNTTDVLYPDHLCIHQYFESKATQSPDAIAIVHENQSLTYSELNARVNILAHHLIDLGVRPDSLGAICVERSLAMVVGILAILKAGGAYVPLDPVYASERLLDIISDASPSILLADKLGCDTLDEAALSSLTVIDPNVQMKGSTENPDVATLTSHHLAYVIYTSGSTGKPKGVMVEHAQVTRLFDATEYWYHFNESDTWILAHSFSFDVSVWELWGALRYGGKLIIPSHRIIQSPEDFYHLICKEGVTVLNMTPSAFRPLIRLQTEVEHNDKLRYIILAGEALEPVILKLWYAIRSEDSPQIINMYGPTKTTIYAMYRAIKEQDCSQFVSPIGVRVPDLTIYVLDNHGFPAPLGTIEELCIGGAGVTRGYLNRAELTSERFPLDPFSKTKGSRIYKTGDLVRYLPDGNFIFLGRNDHQVKIRGFRIELGEIEARLAEHPLVREATVVALGTDSDKRLIAYVVADAADRLAQLLRDHLTRLLPEYMIPAAYVRLDALPRTVNGKLDRRAFPELKGDIFAGQDYEAPQGEAEIALAAIWADLLKIKESAAMTTSLCLVVTLY
ncbi:hypothetical protein BGZ79_010521 [Entomortierella chlamydospora]|nr:hypothetical protein BGZ79_010521 [Entomortierella chlamydospora]